MYKKKLGTWNAFKNLRSSDVLQLLRLKKSRDADQKQSIFLVRGKTIDAHSLQVYLSRNPWLLARAQTEGALEPEAARDVICYSPEPQQASNPDELVNTSASRPSSNAGSPKTTQNLTMLLPSPASAPRPPDIHAAPETVYRALRDHLNHCVLNKTLKWVDNGHRKPRRRRLSSVLLNSFLDRVMTAALAVSRQVNLVIVRHALYASFAVLVRIFRSPPPDLIPKLLTLATRLNRLGRDEIGHIIVRFSRDLAFALRGPHDPLTIFWQGLMVMDINQQISTTEGAFDIYLEEFEKHFGPSHDLLVEVYLLYYDIFERQKPPQTQLRNIKSQLEKFSHQLIDQTLLGSLLLERQLATCKVELEEGHLEKAEAALLDLDADHTNLRDEPFRFAWLGYVRWIMGNLTAAEQAYRHGITLAERTGSRDILCEALFQLERFLSYTGQHLESEAMRARRFTTVQRAGLIVATDVDGDNGALGANEAPSGTSSITKIHIASGASGEKWRPGAFAELTDEPWALLSPENAIRDEEGGQTTGLFSQKDAASAADAKQGTVDNTG